MRNWRSLIWDGGALLAGLPLAVFVCMIVTVLLGPHDSRMGFVLGTVVGVLLVRSVVLVEETVLRRAGKGRAAMFLGGVLLVSGAAWLLARAYARAVG